MHSQIKGRIAAIGAFCSGLVGGSFGTFKQWAANISPEWSNLLGALLAGLVGALVFSWMERRYVQPLGFAQKKEA